MEKVDIHLNYPIELPIDRMDGKKFQPIINITQAVDRSPSDDLGGSIMVYDVNGCPLATSGEDGILYPMDSGSVRKADGVMTQKLCDGREPKSGGRTATKQSTPKARTNAKLVSQPLTNPIISLL